jgi:hypothetical protein
VTWSTGLLVVGSSPVLSQPVAMDRAAAVVTGAVAVAAMVASTWRREAMSLSLLVEMTVFGRHD